MATQFHMPACGERSVPSFDKAKLCELPRFFNELEYLFTRAALVDDTNKKKQALRYVDFEVEQIWKTFPEYSNEDNTYEDFKEAILVHYPDASGDYIYSLRDMDQLIRERQRLGIKTTNDLTEYHLQFLMVTAWLKDKKQLGDLEQMRGYLRGFQPVFLLAVNNQLQMKFPDHHPNILHKIQDVYKAARFIMQSAPTNTQHYFDKAAHGISPPYVPKNTVAIAKPEPPIKTESLGAILSEFTKTIVEAINLNNGSRPSGSTCNTNCSFCDGPHFICECNCINDYCRAGKCKRNAENKVVLSSGAFVPREIPGNNLKERIDEWHRHNLNSLTTATLIHTIVDQA